MKGRAFQFIEQTIELHGYELTTGCFHFVPQDTA